MNQEAFEKVFEDQVEICRTTLLAKSKEYSTDADKLHNFKVAGALKCETPEAALAGMMGKHTVSIYDCIRKIELDPVSNPCGDPTQMDLWEEKIKDHINYLILLKALLIERRNHLTFTIDFIGGDPSAPNVCLHCEKPIYWNVNGGGWLHKETIRESCEDDMQSLMAYPRDVVD